MTTKKIKLLVTSSYENNRLSEEKVFNIVKFLKRAELKKFIGELKACEAKKNIIVTLPSESCNQEFFESLFAGKNLVFRYDSSLLVGVRIEDNDNVYDFSLKNILEKESSFIKHYYD